MSGINLLGTKKENAVKNLPKVRLLRRIAVILLVSISAISVILFLLILFSPLPALQKEEKHAITVLSASHTDIAKLILVKDRLESSKSIISHRSTYEQNLLKIMDTMPDGVTIIEMGMKEKKISLRVSSNSLALLDTFITGLVHATMEKKEFSDVTMIDLESSDQRNTYLMTIQVGIL